jgi:hypothetical protein
MTFKQFAEGQRVARDLSGAQIHTHLERRNRASWRLWLVKEFVSMVRDVDATLPSSCCSASVQVSRLPSHFTVALTKPVAKYRNWP